MGQRRSCALAAPAAPELRARLYRHTRCNTRERTLGRLSGPGPGTRPREAGLKYLAVSHGLRWTSVKRQLVSQRGERTLDSRACETIDT